MRKAILAQTRIAYFSLSLSGKKDYVCRTRFECPAARTDGPPNGPDGPPNGPDDPPNGLDGPPNGPDGAST